MEAPLSGLRVLEIASYIAVPAATTILADWGADVIKVEVPWGEVYRNGTPRRNGYASDFPLSAIYEMDNRGKRSLALDLALPQSIEALGKLAQDVDLIVTNVLPGRLAKFGLEPEALLEKRPELIFARVGGYSPYGEQANDPGFDHTSFFAASGLIHMTRDPSAPPAFPRAGAGDHPTALALVAGIMAALRTRDKTGQGQIVDVNLQHVGLYVNGNDSAQALAAQEEPPPHDRGAPRNPLWNFYRSRDDRWLLLVMIDSNRYWPTFTKLLGRPELQKDERFADAPARYRNSRELTAIVDAFFAEEDFATWKTRLAEAGVIWAPVQTPLEAVSDPRLEGNGVLLDIEHPSGTRYKTIAAPIRLSAHPVDGVAAPELAAHTAEILEATDLDPETIELLKAVARP